MWSKKEVIYHILVDRFAYVDPEKARRPLFAGGTIKGIGTFFPYIEELGVTAIWLSPITKTSAYHGYHVTDFTRIDPRFGTLQDFRDFIEHAHKHNIKIILDYVPNHVSVEHPLFKQAMQDKKSPYRQWFYFNGNSYKTFLHFKSLAKLNLDGPAGEHIISAAKYWLSLGVDGLRIDHAVGPSISFWKKFRKEIKEEYPQALLLGEVWMHKETFNKIMTTNAQNKFFKWILKAELDDYMKDYQDVFDGCLDFTFNKLLKEYILGHENKEEFATELVKHYQRFKQDFFLPTFLDNHDMDRFTHLCKNKEQLKQAINLQFAQNQPAIIYYGDEIGMKQEKKFSEFAEHGDLQARQPMDWTNMDRELLELYREKIRTKVNQ